jgi:AraC-like DNA-binding protein
VLFGSAKKVKGFFAAETSNSTFIRPAQLQPTYKSPQKLSPLCAVVSIQLPPTAFSRAFKFWTGAPPSTYRRRARAGLL